VHLCDDAPYRVVARGKERDEPGIPKTVSVAPGHFMADYNGRVFIDVLELRRAQPLPWMTT